MNSSSALRWITTNGIFGEGWQLRLDTRTRMGAFFSVMTDGSSNRNVSLSSPAVLLIVGLLVGAGIGFYLGSGKSTRSGSAESQELADADAVTFGGSAPSKRQRGDVLSELLDSRNSSRLDSSRHVLAFVDSLTADEFETQINETFARRRGNQGYDLISKLYQKWVETDPAEALSHAENLTTGKDRNLALNVVLSAVAVKDPYKVLAWLEEHETTAQSQSRAALDSALRSIAQKNPEEAIALAKRSKSLDPGFLYAIWAENDPQAAAARALSIPNSQERKNAIGSLSRQWAMEDAQAAWDWGNSLESTAGQDAVRRSVVGVLAGNGDTSQAIAFLESMSPGRGRSGALSQIASILANTDPEQAYELVKSQALNRGDEQAYSSIFYQWARTDPSRSFQVAFEQLDPGDARNSAIQATLSEVATHDAALALEMIEKLDEVTLSNSAYSVARALAGSDRGLAVSWAESLPDGESKSNALSSILSEWAEEEPLQASIYGLKIADKNARRRGLGNALSQWGQEDPVEAMTWAVKNLGAEDQENLIPGNLLSTWANDDVEGAAEWVGELPEGKLRDRSVSSLVSNWANQDVVAAGEWLNRLPQGESRDRAVNSYASRVFDTDPEAALAWAESIGQESQRLNQVENLARRYLQSSPEKAKRWIASSSMPPEKRAGLLKQAENR